MFRGFLLTSLTRFMPTPAAVAVSALAFGAAHLSPRDFPVLVALGLLLGASYVRSRNLLTPILIHGAWNSAVLTLLFALAAEGVDVQRLIEVRAGGAWRGGAGALWWVGVGGWARAAGGAVLCSPMTRRQMPALTPPLTAAALRLPRARPQDLREAASAAS